MLTHISTLWIWLINNTKYHKNRHREACKCTNLLNPANQKLVTPTHSWATRFLKLYKNKMMCKIAWAWNSYKVHQHPCNSITTTSRHHKTKSSFRANINQVIVWTSRLRWCLRGHRSILNILRRLRWWDFHCLIRPASTNPLICRTERRLIIKNQHSRHRVMDPYSHLPIQDLSRNQSSANSHQREDRTRTWRIRCHQGWVLLVKRAWYLFGQTS